MTNSSSTDLTFDPGTRKFIVLGFPLLGVAAGLALPRIAIWAAEQRWVPFKGPLSLIASWQGPALTIILILLGFAAGVGLAVLTFRDSLHVTVTDDAMLLRKGGETRTVDRPDVSAVFLDGKYLVLQDKRSAEIERESHESTAALVEETLHRHRWPWTDKDPRGEEFRRWVPGTPDVEAAANALLAARQRALDRKDSSDVIDFRRELAGIDIVVRDENRKQYWRRIAPAPESGAPEV